MSENLNKAFLISTIIANYYDKLVRYTIQEQEDSEEYEECIEKIKKAKQIENQIYKKLTFKEIVEYLRSKKFQDDIAGKATLAQARIYKKLIIIGQKHLEENTENENPLSNIIDNAILLEALKKTTEKINNIEEDTIYDEESLRNLKRYNKVGKYGLLMDDDFIETLALTYNYDVDKIPLTPLDKIKDEKDKSIIATLIPVLSIKFFKELDTLQKINCDDPMLNTYYAYVILSKIEIILNNMNKTTLEKTLNSFEKKYKDNNTEVIKYVRALTNKRKEK